jgi:hypothetical protein
MSFPDPTIFSSPFPFKRRKVTSSPDDDFDERGPLGTSTSFSKVYPFKYGHEEWMVACGPEEQSELFLSPSVKSEYSPVPSDVKLEDTVSPCVKNEVKHEMTSTSLKVEEDKVFIFGLEDFLPLREGKYLGDSRGNPHSITPSVFPLFSPPILRRRPRHNLFLFRSVHQNRLQGWDNLSSSHSPVCQPQTFGREK